MNSFVSWDAKCLIFIIINKDGGSKMNFIVYYLVVYSYSILYNSLKHVRFEAKVYLSKRT